MKKELLKQIEEGIIQMEDNKEIEEIKNIYKENKKMYTMINYEGMFNWIENYEKIKAEFKKKLIEIKRLMGEEEKGLSNILLIKAEVMKTYEDYKKIKKAIEKNKISINRFCENQEILFLLFKISKKANEILIELKEKIATIMLDLATEVIK